MVVRMCGVGWGSCVEKTFQSENWHLPFKGLITHTPLASNRITSHVGAVCGFREEVVWLYKSCCHQYRWRNATVHESVVIMIFFVYHVCLCELNKCMPMSLNSCPKVHFSPPRYLPCTSEHKFLGISLFL